MTDDELAADLVMLLGDFLTLVGLDGTTADATNDSLRIPIRRALAVQEAGTAAGESILDLAEYHAIWLVLGHYTKVDQSAGEESQSLSQRFDWLWKRLAKLKEDLGSLVETPEAGTVPPAAAIGQMRAGQCMPTRARAIGYGVMGQGWSDAYGGHYGW